MNSFCSKNKTSSIWRGVAPIHINWFIAQSKKSKQVLVWNNILTVWIPRLKVIIYLCDCYACSLCCTVILCVSLINSCHSLPSNTCHMMVIRILGMQFSQIFSERWLKKRCHLISLQAWICFALVFCNYVIWKCFYTCDRLNNWLSTGALYTYVISYCRK